MKNILIIEDDTDIQEILTYILEEKGYRVYCSVNGDDIEDLSDILPDLIILDLRLHGSLRTGAEICVFLKQQPVTRYLPVILVSAEYDIKDIAEACGANDFIRKPFDIDNLTSKVKAILASK